MYLGLLRQRQFRFGDFLIAGVFVASAAAGLFVNLFSHWAWAATLSALLMVAGGVLAVRGDAGHRLAAFFTLFAISDFAKRAVFLVSGQAAFSQYLVFIVPTTFYVLAVLVPGLPSIASRRLSALERIVLAYVGVSLLTIWLYPGFSIAGRASASALLILPWTMVLIGRQYARSAAHSLITLGVWGVASTLYAVWLFFAGPTVIERRWAEETSAFSIGASHLDIYLSGNQTGAQIWRVTGFQPDGFTFGLFLLLGFISLSLLRAQRRVSPFMYWTMAGILVIGIGISVVRTIWAAFLTFAVCTGLLRCHKAFVRPWLLMLLLALLLTVTQVLSGWLSDYAHLRAGVSNPVLARALTLGTLDAREHALTTFVHILPARWLFGVGHTASPWITGKFGAAIIPPDTHNVIVEQLFFTGLPGLLLFLGFFYRLFRDIEQSMTTLDKRARLESIVLVSAIIGLFVTGLLNGGVFLSYPFFFLAGLAGSGPTGDHLGGDRGA